MGPFCLFSVHFCFSLEGSVRLDCGHSRVRGRGHVDPCGGGWEVRGVELAGMDLGTDRAGWPLE